MTVERKEYTNVHRRRGTRREENTFPIPWVECCTECPVPPETGHTPKPSHPTLRTCLFPSRLAQSTSVTMSQWDSRNLAAPSISRQAEV